MLILQTKEAIRALSALAQETRLAVFRMLVQEGPTGLMASAIAERIGIPPSSLSFHFKELSHAELVVQRQEGRFVFYSANIDNMNALMAYLTDNCCGGNPCSPVGSVVCVPAQNSLEKA